jgi:hypothetical protein
MEKKKKVLKKLSKYINGVQITQLEILLGNSNDTTIILPLSRILQECTQEEEPFVSKLITKLIRLHFKKSNN